MIKKKRKNKAAQAMAKRRNKIYGKKWLSENAKKAAEKRWGAKDDLSAL